MKKIQTLALDEESVVDLDTMAAALVHKMNKFDEEKKTRERRNVNA